MAGADSYTEDLLDRAANFFDPAVHWQRALWNVGLVLSLQEVVEASDGVQAGAVSHSALTWLATSVRGHLGSDPGVGSDQERRALDGLLRKDLTAGGVNYAELKGWTAIISDKYLARWAQAVSAPDRPSREQASRALASHLLDRGFSGLTLRPWVHGLVAGDPIDAAEVFSAADALLAGSEAKFETMLLFEQPPRERHARPPEWRTAPEVSGWFATHGFPAPRQHGGLLLELQAWDVHRAAEKAADVVDTLTARASVGTRDGLKFAAQVFVAGYPLPIRLSRARRAEVRALEREDRLLLLDQSTPVDSALELLAHLNTAPAAVAAAAAWSAVESLLSGPGDQDKVITGDHLASLVACSWPRAELTTLAWERRNHPVPDALSAELAGFASNRERADRILRAIGANEDLSMQQAYQRMGFRRVEKLAKDPRTGLRAVRRRAEESLRRLYRQRNLVVHGGQTTGVALSGALRTAAPLVGAGLDRVTHASLTGRERPLELAARARLEIERAGTHGGPALTRLLE